MEITVQRDWQDSLSTCGEMFLDGVHECYTLEPPSRTVKPHRIPAGTYEVQLLPSAHFKMVVPCILDVPGFTGIEIHPGNFPKDTDGCTCVGENHTPDFVGESDLAFTNLMEKLKTAELSGSVYITYLDPKAIAA